ncbi:MAG: InlB B-repeat-containing protein, partial [Spirochaetales bacterium]|nr:InlB B-repeat-containing protein [Spirochaetales bacterium]
MISANTVNKMLISSKSFSVIQNYMFIICILFFLSACEMFSRADYSDYMERVNGLYTYSLTYDRSNDIATGNVEGLVPVDSEIYLEGKTAIIQDQGDLTKPYYTFSGWSLIDGGAVDYFPGDSFQFPGSSVVLYAVWSEDSYTVTYDGNGFTGGTLPSAQSSTHADVLALSLNELTRTTYNFIGWNSEADGSGTFYSPGQELNLTSNMTLYAYWSAVPAYLITYNGNGATGGSIPSTQLKYENIDSTLKGAGTLVRENYIFTGWNSSADGSGTSYASGDVYSANQALTLYAQWEISIQGSGTEESPYQIGLAEQLLMIGTEPYGLDDCYLQTDHIDLTGIDFVPIGTSSTPFTGKYNGDGYEILNLTISDFDGIYVGLFGYTQDGSGENIIESVHLKDYSITVNSNNSRYVGSLVGLSGNGTEILNSSADGNITITAMYSTDNIYIGGLISLAESSSRISQCYSKGHIQIENSTATSGVTLFVGGLTGANRVFIANCYSTVSISDNT